jgi:hypothetical protein
MRTSEDPQQANFVENLFLRTPVNKKKEGRGYYAPSLKLHHASYFRTDDYLGTGHTRIPCSLPRTYCN